jgi:hypothetical protein
MPLPKYVPRPGDPSPTVLHLLHGTGHFLLVFTLGLFVFLGIWKPQPYANVWQLVLAHFIGGRALNASIGLEKGFPPLFLFFQCNMQDFILMFIFYPWFVWGYQQLSKVPLIGRMLKQAHDLAVTHKRRVAPFGSLGLIVFVLFPFWGTGPLVGVFVGYLLGLSVLNTFACVMSANILSVAGYIYAYDWLRNWNATAAYVVLGILIVLAVVGIFYERRTRRRNPASEPISEVDTAGNEVPERRSADGHTAKPSAPHPAQTVVPEMD